MYEYICSGFGCCGGKCILRTEEVIKKRDINCPLAIITVYGVRWVDLTPELKEEIF